jgi:hypothetical protein
MTAVGKTIFERLDRGRPPRQPKIDNSELARDLQNWGKPIVRLQDICYRGPGSLRNRKKANSVAETLAGHGWLLPIKGRRRDMKEWRIVRGLKGYPTTANAQHHYRKAKQTPMVPVAQY